MQWDCEREDAHLRVMIEWMQRDGHSEKEIQTAVREASTRGGPERQGASRRPRRLGAFRRRLTT
jgi:hypothetical protein